MTKNKTGNAKTTKSTPARKARLDVHEQVTAQIIKSIEEGVGQWKMPWHNGGAALTLPENVDTKNRYIKVFN